MLDVAGRPAEAVLAVPGHYDEAQLALLLGIAQVRGLKVAALVDSSVAQLASCAPAGRYVVAGTYMDPATARQWLTDSPALRTTVIEQVPSWTADSPSNPTQGIYTAIQDFYSTARKINIYVLGDEFANGSITEVVNYVARINPRDAQGKPRVGIHAIGFPTRFGQTQETGVRFAALMRQLTRANDGTFIGLNVWR